jgi:two-component system, chemotaxis family, protein-glutamate methylesterase/glutaminase
MTRKVRVLVVDDSSTMRQLLVAALSSDPAIEVVGQAGDPIEARQAIKALNPDVVTLDIEMPNMNGLDFLEKIMRLRPMPVIMVSTLTKRGADETIRALEIGAIDCIEKPHAGVANAFAELPSKVKVAASARVQPLTERRTASLERTVGERAYESDDRIIAIGSSTGGVEALLHILSRFPMNCAPTIVVQHMPPSFTKSFAQRLDRVCAPNVVEAFDGARLEQGVVYIAPGGNAHTEIAKAGAGFQCRVRAGERVSGHCPSVDVLFRSVAKSCNSGSVGVILTGMGRDGADGLLEMKKAGAMTFGQNESSCIVYGMPRAAFEIGAVEKQLHLERIGDALVAETAARA